MDIYDGRGKHMIEVAKMNRQTIKKWFEDNPGETMKECHRQTGISYLTVRKHVKDLMGDM